MSDLFKDVIPSILHHKKEVITIDNEKDYVPFIVNKALSFHYDCILYANEMNMYPNLDKILQYQFLINTVRGYKRPFQKWLKKDEIDNLKMIEKYYNFSTEKAKEALLLLSEEQLKKIEAEMFIGGYQK